MSPRAEALLSRDVSEAVAALAYGHLADATAALAENEQQPSAKSLHGFRLAVRRLRSLLEAYGPWLGRAAGEATLRRFRRLGRLTNKGRDTDVRLAWIETHRKALPRDERKSTRRLLRRLRSVRRKGYERAGGRARQDFERAARKLVKRLQKLEKHGRSLPDVLPSLLRRQTSELEVRLVTVRSVDDVEGAHDARIAGKHLRHLIEPLAQESEEAGRLLDRLRSLQDLLGELNDLHLVEETLSEELKRLKGRGRRTADPAEEEEGVQPSLAVRRDALVGIEALATIARARRNVLFAELQHAWLDGRGRGFFDDVASLAGALVGEPRDESQLAMELYPSGENAGAEAPENEATAQPKEPGSSDDHAVIPLRPQQNRSYASRRRSAS
jgi:CHAD domain-containing protein